MTEINIDFIENTSRQIDAFFTALKAFIYYTEISKQIDKGIDSQEFWNFIEFTSLYTLLTNWNQVFGINNDNKLWKEITFEKSEYLNKLYTAGNFNYASWTEYRSYINELNHSFILFPDPYHHKEKDYDFEGVKVSLEITREWLHNLIVESKYIKNNQALDKWPILNNNYIEELRAEVREIFKVN